MNVTKDTSTDDLLAYIKSLEHNLARMLVDANRASLNRHVREGNRYVTFNLLSNHTLPYAKFIESCIRPVDTLTVDLYEHL